MFLLKILYYAGLCISTFITVFYFLATLYGFTQQVSANKHREDVIMLIATLVAMAFLFRAFQLGHQQNHWGAGIGMIAIAVVAFVVIFVGGMLLFGKIHWQ